MLKSRYFQLRLPCSFSELTRLASNVRGDTFAPEISVITKLKGQVVLRASFTRYISTKTLSSDGNLITTAVPTIETHTVKIFEQNHKFFLCCIDPPRGSKFVEEILTSILPGLDYFFEAVELDRTLIFLYIANFNSIKLVSAKVRDFHVCNNAVGRLEISSQDGLADEIAPFLKGKHYKIDALTYNVSHGRFHGLIYFSRNGTLRLSDGLQDIAIPLFERALGEQKN